MTKKRLPATPLRRQDFTDREGVPHRVLLPEGDTDISAGIPVSLDLSPLYGHMPASFQAELYQALHAQGLVEPEDYHKPGADQRFKAAMLSVIRHDFLSVQQLIQQENKHA